MSVYPTNMAVEATRPVTLASSGRITSSMSVTVGDRVVKAASKQAATARSAAAQNFNDLQPRPYPPAKRASRSSDARGRPCSDGADSRHGGWSTADGRAAHAHPHHKHSPKPTTNEQQPRHFIFIYSSLTTIMPTVATAAVRGANRTEESLAGGGWNGEIFFSYYLYYYLIINVILFLILLILLLLVTILMGGQNSN